MRLFFIVMGICILSGGSVLADGATDFANANREYAAQHYQAATEGYEALVRAGQWNSALFYNLGNAWYRRGDIARAILNYERALALEPQHAEAARAVQLKTALAKNVNPNVVDATAAAAAFKLDESTRQQLETLFQHKDELRYSGEKNGDETVSPNERQEVLHLIEQLHA